MVRRQSYHKPHQPPPVQKKKKWRWKTIPLPFSSKSHQLLCEAGQKAKTPPHLYKKYEKDSSWFVFSTPVVLCVAPMLANAANTWRRCLPSIASGWTAGSSRYANPAVILLPGARVHHSELVTLPHSSASTPRRASMPRRAFMPCCAATITCVRKKVRNGNHLDADLG